MTSSSKIPEIRRCRPLLGTFVDITVQGRDTQKMESAIHAGFCEVERIEKLMSAHDPESELSRLNREACQRSIKVSDETFQIMKRGLELARRSNGAFDFTVGATLARWKFLPKNLKRDVGSTWRDVQLLSKNRIRFLRPLVVDLGGIAKGHAVDGAVNVLQDHGVDAGVVNAGGDLRAFGSKPIRVHLRHPQNPSQLVNPLRLNNAALATSSPSFTRKQHGKKTVSHLVQPDTGAPIIESISVSVRAAECWLADALTKVVFNLRDRAEDILSEYDAEAFVIAV